MVLFNPKVFNPKLFRAAVYRGVDGGGVQRSLQALHPEPFRRPYWRGKPEVYSHTVEVEGVVVFPYRVAKKKIFEKYFPNS